MSLLFGSRREARSDHPTNSLGELFRRRIGPTAPGTVPVNVRSALTHSAVYQCADLIADLVSTFPTKRFREVKGDGGVVEKVESTRKSFMDDPSDEIDFINWKRIMVIAWLLRGYQPGLITSLNGPNPGGIELIHPDRVRAERYRPDSVTEWYLDGKEIELWPRGRLWLAQGKMMQADDVVGRSVLEFAAQEVGLGLTARQFGSEWFANGAHPTAMIKNSKKVEGLDEDGARRVKERFMNAVRGNREPVVMTDGWEYQAIQVRPNESQFLETINANRVMVAGFFRVPGSIIGAGIPSEGAGITYTNVEHRGLDLLKFTIGPWVNRMEIVLDALLTGSEYVKLNVDALLRGDTGSRYRAHDISVRAGFKTVNEVRADEDLPPVEGGDQTLWPPYRSNMTDDEAYGDPDEGDDPNAEPSKSKYGEGDEPKPPAGTPAPKGKAKPMAGRSNGASG